MRLGMSLFDDDVLFADGDPNALPVALFPEEEAQIGRAVEKRVREYGAVRGLYRSLLPAVGRTPTALVNADDRAPIWPAGLVGTITHTHGYCAVAITTSPDVLGLGLDAERAGPLKPGLWKTICTPSELARLHAMPELEAGELGKLIFSAKECAYKAQYARTRAFLGFQAMRIDVDFARSRFVATFEQPAGEIYAPGDALEGRFVTTEALVLTSLTIRR